MIKEKLLTLTEVHPKSLLSLFHFMKMKLTHQRSLRIKNLGAVS